MKPGTDGRKDKMTAPQTVAFIAAALAVAFADGSGDGAGTATVNGALEATVAVTATGMPALSSVLFSISRRGAVPRQIHPLGRPTPQDGGYPKTFTPSFSFSVDIPGTSLQTGVITHANSRYAHSQVQATSEQADGLWIQHFSAQDPSSEKGTFTLTISSIGSITATDAGPLWRDAHGKLSATLPASTYTPDAGTVRVEVTF